MALIPMPTTREAWLEMRQQRVGASEVAALFGVQPAYALSHFALWHVKAGTAPAPPVEGKRISWGLKLEEVVAMAAAEEKGWTVRKGRYAVCDDCPGLAASLDFEIDADPTGEFEGPGCLETKNVDWLVHKRSWSDGEPPVAILLQLQSQMAASNYKWGAVAGLVGGNDLAIYPYAAKPDLIVEIKRRVSGFWTSIAQGNAPPVDGSDGAAEILKSLYPDIVDDVIEFQNNNEWPVVAENFLNATAAKKKAIEDYDEARSRLAIMLGSHKRAWGQGYSVNTSVIADIPDRPAEPGEIISGRAGHRRYSCKRYA